MQASRGRGVSQINKERILRLPAQYYIVLLIICFANVAIPDLGKINTKRKKKKCCLGKTALGWLELIVRQ